LQIATPQSMTHSCSHCIMKEFWHSQKHHGPSLITLVDSLVSCWGVSLVCHLMNKNYLEVFWIEDFMVLVQRIVNPYLEKSFWLLHHQLAGLVQTRVSQI
jgi:hypothetical protein